MNTLVKTTTKQWTTQQLSEEAKTTTNKSPLKQTKHGIPVWQCTSEHEVQGLTITLLTACFLHANATILTI